MARLELACGQANCGIIVNGLHDRMQHASHSDSSKKEVNKQQASIILARVQVMLLQRSWQSKTSCLTVYASDYQGEAIN